jgi:NADH dehydrogenase
VASHISKENPKGLPMLASVAQQHRKHLANNSINLIKEKPLQFFVYKDKGTMATIGRGKAFVFLPNWNFQGTFAWLVWMFIHIMSLVCFRNKAIAF